MPPVPPDSPTSNESKHLRLQISTWWLFSSRSRSAAAAQILSAPINLGGPSRKQPADYYPPGSLDPAEFEKYPGMNPPQLTPCWSHFLPCSIISENNQKVLSMECNHRTPCIISIHTSYSLFLYTSTSHLHKR